MTDETRRRFEQWAMSQRGAEPDETKLDDIGQYKYSDVAYGWKAWQAALAYRDQRGSTIPFVKRATGRTLPDLRKREHLCEWQATVGSQSSLPSPPEAKEP